MRPHRTWAVVAFVVGVVVTGFFGVTFLRVVIPTVQVWSTRGLGTDESVWDVLFVFTVFAIPFFVALALTLLFGRLGGARPVAAALGRFTGARVRSLFEFNDDKSVAIILSGLAVSIGLAGALDFSTTLIDLQRNAAQYEGQILQVWSTVRGVTTVFVLPTILGVWGFWRGITSRSVIAMTLAVVGPFVCLLAIAAVGYVGIVQGAQV